MSLSPSSRVNCCHIFHSAPSGTRVNPREDAFSPFNSIWWASGFPSKARRGYFEYQYFSKRLLLPNIHKGSMAWLYPEAIILVRAFIFLLAGLQTSFLMQHKNLFDASLNYIGKRNDKEIARWCALIASDMVPTIHQ